MSPALYRAHYYREIKNKPLINRLTSRVHFTLDHLFLLSLFYRYALCQVSGTVNVLAFADGNVVG